MPTPERDHSAKQRPTPKPDRKAEPREEEVLREQSTTEIEERPYLDTEGGE